MFKTFGIIRQTIKLTVICETIPDTEPSIWIFVSKTAKHNLRFVSAFQKLHIIYEIKVYTAVKNV